MKILTLIKLNTNELYDHRYRNYENISVIDEYPDIVNKLSLFIKRKEFTKYKYKFPKNSEQIKSLSTNVRLKVNSLCI